MFASDSDEIGKEEFIVLELELLLEHADSELVEVKGHIGYHFFILLLYFFVACSGRVDGVNVQGVFG